MKIVCERGLIVWEFVCCVRLFRVGIELPTVEVRYENLTVKANCHVGTRGLPTLWNVFRNIIEVRSTLSLSKFSTLSHT